MLGPRNQVSGNDLGFLRSKVVQVRVSVKEEGREGRREGKGGDEPDLTPSGREK